ncbi:MAG: YfhO family protein [Candidatus Hydrogenedentota bacterium]
MNDRVEQPRSSSLGWREVLVHALLLLVLLAVLFPGVFFRDELALPGGWLTTVKPWSQHMPAEAEAPKNSMTHEAFVFLTKTYFVTQESLEAGEWPLWNRYEMMGMPQLANYQSNPFYPCRLLNVFLGIYAATSTALLLRLWMCGMSAYICGRGIGIGKGASRFFSFAWMLSSFNLLWAYWPVPDNSAWAPLIFLGAEWLLRGRSRRGFALLTVSATLTLLTGHPETALAFGLGIGMYFLLRVAWMLWTRQPVRRPIGLALGAWGVALLIAAVVIVPFLEYMFHSHTVALRDVNNIEKHFIPLGGLLGLWVPRFFGATVDGNYWNELNPEYLNWSIFISMLYPGMAVWFAILSLFSRSRSWVHGMAVCVGFPALLHLLMTVNTPFMQPLHTLPLLSAMWRCWYVSFAMFAFALLGALGLEHWLRHKRPLKAMAPHIIGAGVIGAIIVAVLWLNAPIMRQLEMLSYVHREIATAFIFALCSLILFALAGRFPDYRRYWVLALTLLLTIDLLYATRDMHPTSPKKWVFPETQATKYFQNLPDQPRVGVFTAGINPGLFPQCGIEQLWGHDGIYPHRNIVFLGELGIPTAETALAMEPVCGVTHYLYDPEIPARMPFDDSARFKLVHTVDGIEVYENLRAFPRAFLVNHAQTVATLDEMFEIMADPGFEPRKTCLLESPLVEPLPSDHDMAEGHAQVIKRSGNEVIIEVTAEQDAILVLNDAFYPGWKAWIDDGPTEVFPAYSIFRAVRVPEGDHTIVFRFRPWSFRIGLSLSIATLLFALVWALWYLRRSGMGERARLWKNQTGRQS